MQARLAIEHGKTVFLVESLVMQQKWLVIMLHDMAEESP